MEQTEKFLPSLDLRDRVINKLDEIETELRTCVSDQPGLFFGNMGLALFYDAKYDVTGNVKYLDECYLIVDRAVDQLENVELSHTYADGYTGVAWAINYLLRRGNFQIDANDLFSEIDAHIFRSATLQLNTTFLEYFHGAGGAVLYALDRLGQPHSIEFLARFIEAVNTQKAVTPKGYKWRDDFSRLPGPKDVPKSTTGLSHGVSGIVSLLVKIHKRTNFKIETEGLINGGISWLLNQSSADPTTLSVYPTFTIEEEPAAFISRLGWCQGDLSVAITMMNAGRALGREEWVRHGIEIMEKASRRLEMLPNGLEDACLCHGTAGVAHVFNRFAEWTQREDFKKSGRYWIWQTLRQAKYHDGLAGYKTIRPPMNPGDPHEVRDHGFIEGVAGIGLALMSYLNPRQNWDEILLITD